MLIFFFKDQKGEIHTPIPDSFLDGITRRTVIDIAKSKGIKIYERKIKPEELKNFVGCFLTASIIHFPAMRSTMANLWHPVCGIQIRDLVW